MDNNRKLEIEKYIIFCIYDEMKNVFPNLQVARKETYNASLPCLPFQFYCNEKFNKIYLYYDLDKASKYAHDPYNMALRINSRLKENFYRDMNINICILGPYARVEQNPTVHLQESSNICIRPYTISYWKCFDGVYRFIEDINISCFDRHQFLIRGNINFLYEEFDKKILDINSRFDFISKNETDVSLGFEEYCDLYKSIFNRSLKKIEDQEISTIFLDIYEN